MRLVRKLHSKDSLIYSDIKNIVVIKKIDSLHNKLYSYYEQIKDKKKENGIFMIKRLELRYRDVSWNKFAGNKSYFCYADSGICFTYNKKDNIFKLNNKIVAIKLTKLLLQNSPEHLFALVNRKTGEHTYFVSDSWYNSEISRNNLVILK